MHKTLAWKTHPMFAKHRMC